MNLVTVQQADAGWIEPAIERWAASLRWDLRGDAVPPLLMQDLLWGDAVRQYAVWHEEEPVGLLQLCGIDLPSGVANLEVLVDPAHVPHVVSQVQEFLRDAFGAFPLRKVMLHVGTGSLDAVSLLGERGSHVVRHAANYPAHLHAGGGEYRAVDVFEISPVDPGVEP